MNLSTHFRTTARLRRASFIGGFAGVLVLVALVVNCQRPVASSRSAGAAPAPVDLNVVALGNLRGNKTPSQTETRLAEFLFGTEPESPLGLLKPTSIAIDGDAMLICDPAQGAVFRFDCSAGTMKPFRTNPDLQRPNAIESSGDGEWLICDVGASVVLRLDARGSELGRYTNGDESFRPADVVRVNDEVWVANSPMHRIEVFDFAGGAHRRSIGSRGSEPGQFGFPLGMAIGPDGRVYVADSLNHRVQVLDPDGTARGVVGKPGDRVGSFGRPKDVAVAADGTVFVVDASSQRVHAFDATGRVITAFGEPPGGKNDLCLPAGIAVSTGYAGDRSALPPHFLPDCHVFVTEQIRSPGVRVFAWRRPPDWRAPTFPPRAGAGEDRRQWPATNPHWSAEGCTHCHADGSGKLEKIAASEVDRTCVSCHDGVRAHAEAHPIGRKGRTEFASVPDGWPLNQDRLSCLTCHDVQRHCDTAATRPEQNSAMLRGPTVERRLDFCTNCHTPSESWRINPHRQLAADGTMRSETCGFCHSATPAISPDGRRSHDPGLRASASGVCLGCHAPHWDYFPGGHLDRPVTEEIRRRLIAREFAGANEMNGEARTAEFETAVRDSGRRPQFLPLAEDRVACYTCHNPHERGLFPSESPMGRMALNESDAGLQLRSNRTDLCQSCHSK